MPGLESQYNQLEYIERSNKSIIGDEQKKILNKIYGIYSNIEKRGIQFRDKFPDYNNISDLLKDPKLINQGMGGLLYELVIIEMFTQFIGQDSYITLSNQTMDKDLAIDMYGNIGGLDLVIQFSINGKKKGEKKNNFFSKWEFYKLKYKRKKKKEGYFRRWKMLKRNSEEEVIQYTDQKALYIHINDKKILNPHNMIKYFSKWCQNNFQGHWLDYSLNEKSINSTIILSKFKTFVQLIEKFINKVHSGDLKTSEIISINNESNIYLTYHYYESENKIEAGIIDPSGINMGNRVASLNENNILGEITLFL